MSDRIQVFVLLTAGDFAFVRVPGREESLRMSAATIAADANLPAGELAGRDFYATVREMADGMVLSNFELVNDPRI